MTQNAIATRPIWDLIKRIKKKEADLKEKGLIPNAVICGAGTTGSELGMALKIRWEKIFGEGVKVSLLA